MRFPQIDAFQFARTGQKLAGRCPAAAFGRLEGMVSASNGEIEYEVSGTGDDVGRPALRVRLGGELELTCQRCLKAMPFALRVDSVLVLARSEAEMESQPIEPEGPDWVLGSKELAVGTLLEDEALLAIPFAPRHEKCAGDGAPKAETQASPFSELRGLLTRGGRARN